MRRIRFSNSDPWILLSAAACNFRGACTLRQLIAAADHVNHAIPGRNEIEGGVNRLAAAGLLSVSSGFFRLTPRSRRLLLAMEARDRKLLRQWRMLGEKLPSLSPPADRPRRWRLDPGRYRKAVAAYQSSFVVS